MRLFTFSRNDLHREFRLENAITLIKINTHSFQIIKQNSFFFGDAFWSFEIIFSICSRQNYREIIKKLYAEFVKQFRQTMQDLPISPTTESIFKRLPKLYFKVGVLMSQKISWIFKSLSYFFNFCLLVKKVGTIQS